MTYSGGWTRGRTVEEGRGQYLVRGDEAENGAVIAQFHYAHGVEAAREQARRWAQELSSAPDLYSEASLLRMLASSPRFQSMTVADALAELAANGCGHDGGAALAKARGEPVA